MYTTDYIPGQALQQARLEAAQQAKLEALQQAKLEALQQVLGNLDDYRYLDLNNLIDPNNKNWADYTYWLGSHNNRIKRQGHIDAATPSGLFINSIRNAETIDDVRKQSDLWNSYNPLSSRDNARKYFRFMVGGKEPDPVQATTGGAQGVQGTQAGVQAGTQGAQGVQGVQAGAKTGNAVAEGGVQGSNNGSGKKPRMSDAEINAFLNEELGGDTTGNGTYDPYDPNPGNVSLAYAMRNAPEQERRTALINKWNQEHGISYATGTGSTGYATGQGMLTSGSNGTYATGEGIKDANGNVLTNPGGDWEYQYALRDPQYGLGMMGKMSDAQKNYLQAVSDNMGYNYNFNKGATRFV